MAKVHISTENRAIAKQAAERHNNEIGYKQHLTVSLSHVAALHSNKSAINCAKIINKHKLNVNDY